LLLFVKPFACHVRDAIGGAGQCASEVLGRLAFEGPTDPETVWQITFVSKGSLVFASLVVTRLEDVRMRGGPTMRKQRTGEGKKT